MTIKHVRARSILFLLSILIVYAASGCRAATPTPTRVPVSIRIGGSDSMQWLARDLATAYHQARPYATVTIQVSNSDNGLKELARGALDLALSSRALTADDLARRPVHVIEIARDGIVLIVHPDNPLEGVTREQVSKIYAGEIINWSEFKIPPPGETDPIQVVSREGTSGTRRVFEEMLLTGRRITSTALLQSGEGSVQSYVNTHPNAIGYVSFMGWKNKPQARVLNIDGVSPTLDTIQDGSYPLIRPIYLVVPDDANTDLSAFVDWVQSQDGHAVITSRAAAPEK